MGPRALEPREPRFARAGIAWLTGGAATVVSAPLVRWNAGGGGAVDAVLRAPCGARLFGPRDQAYTRAARERGRPRPLLRGEASAHPADRSRRAASGRADRPLERSARHVSLDRGFQRQAGRGCAADRPGCGRLGRAIPDRLIATQRDRLQWVARLGSDDGLVVRYEDLVTSTSAVAELLHERLAIDVDHEAAWADTAMRLEHSTAESPAASVGRWRAELTAEQKRLFKRGSAASSMPWGSL